MAEDQALEGALEILDEAISNALTRIEEEYGEEMWNGLLVRWVLVAESILVAEEESGALHTTFRPGMAEWEAYGLLSWAAESLIRDS